MTYTIQTANGKSIPLYFGTWSLARFCELNGDLSFTQMQDLFSTGVSFRHIISLVLCGAEHHAKTNKQPFNYTDVDAADWIDQMGGIVGEGTQEMLLVVGRAINPKIQGVEVVKDKGSKKK
jgi:hypothetical protein